MKLPEDACVRVDLQGLVVWWGLSDGYVPRVLDGWVASTSLRRLLGLRHTSMDAHIHIFVKKPDLFSKVVVQFNPCLEVQCLAHFAYKCLSS
jgi:hypothetical protein